MARKVPARPAPLAFRQGDILRMDGIEYRFSGRRLHDYLMQRLDLPDSPPEHFSVEDLHQLRKDGKLIMVSKQKREGREDLGDARAHLPREACRPGLAAAEDPP